MAPTSRTRKPSTLALIRWSNIWTGPAKSRVHEEDWNGISLKIADPNNCDSMLLETARLLLVRDSASKPWIEIVMKKSFNSFQSFSWVFAHAHTHTHTRLDKSTISSSPNLLGAGKLGTKWSVLYSEWVPERGNSTHTEASPQKRCHGDSICLRIFWRRLSIGVCWQCIMLGFCSSPGLWAQECGAFEWSDSKESWFAHKKMFGIF